LEITTKLKEKIGFPEKVENLINKIFERKSKITQKCVNLISDRLLTRVIENMKNGFGQIPQQVRNMAEA
jgi:uncharacterized protein YjgD (DUF1641 family)